MVDAAKKLMISQVEKPPVDGQALRHSSTQAVAEAVTKVLEDDNLLREIIVRVGFPTTLVRASLVCKRWLGHASDPKFLSRFRKLHPPRLLGYYISKESTSPEKLYDINFVSVQPQLPELAAVIRRLQSYDFGDCDIQRCQNGSVFTRHYEVTRWTSGVHHPLGPEGRTQIFPPLPEVQDQNEKKFIATFLKEEGMSYMYVLGEDTEEIGKCTARAYMLQDGEWLMRTSATCPLGICLHPISMQFGHNKIYLLSAVSDDIVVFDLMSSSYYTIQLPQGLECDIFESVLSMADDPSSVYLMHVKGFQLSIWLHQGDNWSLLDTICLQKMLSNFGMSGHTLEDEIFPNVLIRHVGDNGQFVILEMDDSIFCFEFKCRTLQKVYENTVNDEDTAIFHPFMMIWPPTFPAI